jgi:hypothetical protein
LFSISKRIQESMDPLPGHGIKKNEQGKGREKVPESTTFVPQRPHNDSGSFRGFRISATLSRASEDARRKAQLLAPAPR